MGGAARPRSFQQHITEALGEDVETAIANQKYGFISGALKETYTAGRREETTTTAQIDAFVTHKLWGFPDFLSADGPDVLVYVPACPYPQEWIEMLVDRIGEAVNALLPEGVLRDLLCDGIIGGVGSVIVFLPNIMILYLFISFMEDSGYLARAAFIMDRVMHRLGLHGKSVHPAHHGLRLQRAGHHGLPDDRKPQQPTDYHSDNSVHVMQRTNTPFICY